MKKYIIYFDTDLGERKHVELSGNSPLMPFKAFSDSMPFCKFVSIHEQDEDGFEDDVTEYLGYEQAVAEAKRLSDAYYNGHEEASDSEFDALLEKIKLYEKKFKPLPNSPTQKVGEDDAKGFKKVLHKYPMLSLNKVLNLDELKAWVAETEKAVGKCSYTLEYKMDGAGLELTYKDGKLVEAATRGNGIRGDLVTENALRIRGVVTELKDKVDCTIRGETIFPKSEFNKAVAAGEQLKNCRNTAAGALKLQDPEQVAHRNLRFYGYTLLGIKNESQGQDIDFLSRNGFDTICVYRGDSLDELVSICDRMDQDRRELDFDVDGMVIKIDSKDLQEKMGASATNPKFAVAYKFPNVVVYPRIKSVSFQVGKTGAITPICWYEPQLLCGTTVQKASLHNRSIVEEMGIAVGDVVKVVKRGEIIPQVAGLHEKGENRQEIVFPEKCPCCGSATAYNGERLYCTNPECRDRVIALIDGWSSKKCLDVDGLAGKTIGILYDAGLVRNVADLYDLTLEQLLQLDGFQTKSAKALLKALEKSKSAGLSRVLAGLGIPLIGNTISEEISGKFKSLEGVRNATLEQLSEIENLGDSKASAIVEYMRDNVALLDRIAAIPGMILGEVSVAKASESLAGKTFCITGTLSVSRDHMQAFIKSHGGAVSGSVSGKTSYLVAGVSGGSKLAKAEKLGVRIITEAELYELAGVTATA